MGEKGNGGHIATGGARAVRTAGSVGLGGTNLGSAASAGGGLLDDLTGQAGEHVTDVGLGAADRVQEHRQED